MAETQYNTKKQGERLLEFRLSIGKTQLESTIFKRIINGNLAQYYISLMYILLISLQKKANKL